MKERRKERKSSPQRPDTSRFQDKRRVRQRLSDPPLRKCAQNVAVCDDEEVAFGLGPVVCRVLALPLDLLHVRLVVLFTDLGDESVETADDVGGGSGSDRHN